MKISGKRKVNKMAVLIIAIILILVIVAALFIIKITADRNILDGPGMVNTLSGNLTGVSYNCGGGMDGGSHSMSILQVEDDKYIYDYYKCPYIGAEETSLNIEVSATDFDVFREICHRTECLIYNESTPNEFQVLDAPVTAIVFTLDNGSTISFKDNCQYPPNCNGLFTEVYNALMALYERAE